MRKLLAAGALAAAMITPAQAFEVEILKPIVVAHVNISTQRLHVSINGEEKYVWKVSTGAKGHRTPTGNYKPYRMHRHWWSRQYDMAPMHWALFFHRGYAIHATDYTRNLGVPASHGCVRLHPSNAATLFNLVKKYGSVRTKIKLTGDWRIAERNAPKRQAVASYRRRSAPIRSFASFGN